MNAELFFMPLSVNTSDPDELAKHCMEGIDPDFVNRIASGDIIVAGKNFGCGSSREHAPIAIKYAEIVKGRWAYALRTAKN